MHLFSIIKTNLGTDGQPEISGICESDSEYDITNSAADNGSPTPSSQIILEPAGAFYNNIYNKIISLMQR